MKFTWNLQHQQAFDALCQALSSSPLLDYPTHHDHFVLTTDASDVGIGTILSTECGTVLEYASSALSSAEK